MITRTTLFDLFGDFTTFWPVRVIQPEIGISGTGAPPNPAAWLGALNNGVDLLEIHTGVAGDRVSVEAKLKLDNARTSYADGFPFVIASMPDVEFRIQDIGGDEFFQLFASVSDRGAEVVLEGLPVEIRLPTELIEPHPRPDDHPSGIAEISRGSFSPGKLDSLEVIYRRGNPTSILVHIRLHFNEDGEITIRPAVPISFEKCVLSGMPCLAVHDFTLIPSPSLVPQDVEWIRHTVEPWLPELSGPLDGLFAIRSIHLDSTEAPFKDVAEWLKQNSEHDSDSENMPAAEFVLDDIVVPFFSPYVIPIPRHITLGIRRRIIDPTDPAEIFSFDRAPVKAYLRRDPEISLIIESLFYKSLPSEALSEDLGLTFSAGIVFADKSGPSEGEPEIDRHAIVFGLGENYTIQAGYRREFSSATGLPAPGTGAGEIINTILHWEIATIVIDIMAIRLGYSLGRAIGEEASFLDSAEATVDLFVSMPPTGGDESFFKLRALDGEKIAFAIEGLGWRQGSFHLDGIKMPDGVVAMFGPVGVFIQEIGLLAEQAATYLSFSGGVLIDIPSGFKGGVTFQRLRFRVAGSSDAPPFKLDGFFVFIKTDVVSIQAGGYYTERMIGPIQVKEFGLTGQVDFELGVTEYMFGLDLLIGSLKSPEEEFKYFMFQVFFRGSVMIAWFELRGARVLFAKNMQPKLSKVDRESQDLRYYKWYQSSNPIDVPGDRRLAAWEPQNGAWALGIGVSASIAGLGRAFELGVFVLVVVGDDENGFLIVGEVRVLGSDKPIAFFAIEWDGKNDRFSLVIGVNLKPSNFVEEVPAWLDGIAKLSGTLFISNDPGTFAIGRLADEQTWLSLQFDIDLWLRTFIFFGFCFEYVDGPEGPKGVGLVVRLEGGINAGIVRVTYNAGFGLLVVAFQTGSTDYAAAIWIEAGLRIILFGFLRFGLSARAEFRIVGARPSRGELEARIRLETPWFLPDVTWTFQIVFGELEPEALGTSAAPLRIAAATEGESQKSISLHLERFDPNWNGEGTAPTFSIIELRAGGASEADRLARFEANTSIRPIATDATIAIDWSVAVNDQLALGGEVAPNLGNQRAGDLTLTYDLTGIRVRRRSRFGSDRSWRMLEERLELTADFSDSEGVGLTGAFGPQELNKFWDLDVQIGGEPATKKLLLNARTPFEFRTQNPEVDEELVRDNPRWPCCAPFDDGKTLFKVHEILFRNEVAGIDVDTPRFFTESRSRLNFRRPAYVRPHQFGAAIPSGALVAFVAAHEPGPLFQAELDEDAAFCMVRLAWRRFPAILQLLTFDALGNVVGMQQFPLAANSEFQNLIIPGQGPIRRLEARLVMTKELSPSTEFRAAASVAQQPRQAVVEIDRVAYIGLRHYLDTIIHLYACLNTGDDFTNAYEGRGKIFFLPNHDYEIALTTRVTVAHPSKPAESAEVTEYIYSKTKGLPGLNAVQRGGEEIEPYVNSAYAGGKGRLYREEPVVLAFKEDFYVVVPITLRPAGTTEERHTLLRLQLLVQPNTAPTLETPFTATGEDWIVANRSIVVVLVLTIWKGISTASFSKGTAMMSQNPFIARLATLTQRDDARCDLEDPRNVSGTVLIAPPQGTADPNDPTKQLWPGALSFTATVRPENSGFVDRRGFEPADHTAFDFALNASAGGSSAWTVAEKELRVSGAAQRRFAIFGEPIWNHLHIQLSLRLEVGEAAGLGLALPAGDVPSRGLFALVERQGDGLRLAFYRRESGVQFAEVDHIALPATIDANAPITLVVTAFDDRLRAAVGETMLEMERNEFREGRLCLVAERAARFTSLQVSGLDMYAFPFAVSRFVSFEEHIESFNGKIDVIAPNALGAGTTASSTAALWSATQADIHTAMQLGSDPTTRQALFDRWVNELGLPLKDELTRLEISRFVSANKTELFLLESPEPLDFTEEITITLSQRVPVPPSFPPPVTFPAAEVFPGARSLLPGTRSTDSEERARQLADLQRARDARQMLRQRLAFSERNIGSVRQQIAQTSAITSSAEQLVILNVTRQEKMLRIELDSGATFEISQEKLVFVEAVEKCGERRLKFYAGVFKKQAGSRHGIVLAEETDELTVARKDFSLFVSEVLDGLEPGTVVGLKPGFKDIFDRFRPRFTYEAVDVRVLQDGTAHRALVIPVAGSAAKKLSPGAYRMTFAIDRKRWQTTEPPDDLNRYHKTTTLSLVL